MSATIRMAKATLSICVVSTIGCALEYAEVDHENTLQAAASSVEYQAENATSKSGCTVATNVAGYTGSGFMDYGGNGTWMEWNNVNASTAGNYRLTFRYAVASGARQSAVLINGANVGNVSFSATGSWRTWKTVSITKALKAGNNTIRVLANTSSGGPNLDKMDLYLESAASGQCALVNEGGTANLSCPSGQVISSIGFASYGTPTGSCPAFSASACHASTSKTKVEPLCLNKQSCSVSAQNSVFGDPCPGTYKKLAIVYSCSGGVDACPTDPNKTQPGQCGCGVPEGTCGGTGSGSFTIGVLPDVQKLTLGDENAQWLYKVGDFLAASKNEYNLLAVGSVGDLVQVATLPGTRNQTRWDRVLNFAHKLKASNIAFMPACGNHDGCQDHYGNPADYSAQFSDLVRQNGPDGSPPAYILKRDNPFFRGSYSTNDPGKGAENAYFRFTVGGRSFIVLSLRFGDSSEDSVLNNVWNSWASGVLKANSDATAIIFTHWLEDSPAWLSSTKPALCAFPNVLMAVVGHSHGTRFRKILDCGGGHKVEWHQISLAHGTDELNEAAARLYTFDMDSAQVCFKTRHVYYNKWLTEKAGCNPGVDAHCDEACFALPQ